MKQARLVIRDEVNVKIEGLNLDAQRLVNQFKSDVLYARYLPAVRLDQTGRVATVLQHIIGCKLHTNSVNCYHDQRAYMYQS